MNHFTGLLIKNEPEKSSWAAGLRVAVIPENQLSSTIPVEHVIQINPNTLKEIKAVCACEPFKLNPKKSYTYWINWLGYTSRKQSKNPDVYIRTEPVIYMTIRRDKSRLRLSVPCLVSDWLTLYPLVLEVCSPSIRKDTVRRDTESDYVWADHEYKHP